MERPPRSTSEGLIGGFFYWRTTFVSAIFILFVLGAVAWINAITPTTWVVTSKNTTINGVTYTNYTNTSMQATPGQQHSIALNCLVFCEITYVFNCRFLYQSSCHPRVLFGNYTAWIASF